MILTLPKSQNRMGKKKSGFPPRKYLFSFTFICTYKAALGFIFTVHTQTKKQAISPEKKLKEETGFESLRTPFLHATQDGPGSTNRFQLKKVHNHSCHISNLHLIFHQRVLTRGYHYFTRAVDMI